jgi:hypothetical protein
MRKKKIPISPRNLARSEELFGILREMGIELRSCVVSPQGDIGAVNAHLRLATIDGPAAPRWGR